MRNMRKWMTGLLAAAMLLSLVACSGGEQAPPETESSGQEITLVADFSNGSELAEEFDLIQTETGIAEEATPEAMAQALSEWSGLDFTLNSAAVEEGAVTVDWAADSTLVAGLDDREQKEEFSFHDIDSLRWFMMDSLYSTLTANLGEVEVYYTMDGGQDLSFDELYPVNLFPADTPYLGSPFYFAHAGGQGETDGFDFSRTEGTWWLDGEEDTASIYMDGEGGFIAYYASGSVEAAGYLEYVIWNMWMSTGTGTAGTICMTGNWAGSTASISTRTPKSTWEITTARSISGWTAHLRTTPPPAL